MSEGTLAFFIVLITTYRAKVSANYRPPSPPHGQPRPWTPLRTQPLEPRTRLPQARDHTGRPCRDTQHVDGPTPTCLSQGRHPANPCSRHVACRPRDLCR
ncbi:hypothetical protein BCR44DRAFT_1425174 [Catenaria anguillulae PL171]|uniref:Secreted protein n=1 Tax=Catenaria anguillulae PL171 TaxID=765915 RepID=A0A1Y2I0V8_9FUNG|nr:hypothetical protein BCR44DRAFT_1425174 [Catenaria anguillulae PL171]